ncbi:hypothetical protein MRX96_013211 [Rhipicephalus microplus]
MLAISKQNVQWLQMRRQNSFNFAGGKSQAGLRDDMSQVFYTRNQAHALFPLELETSILKPGQNAVQILHVVSVVNTGDEDIVQGCFRAVWQPNTQCANPIPAEQRR